MAGFKLEMEFHNRCRSKGRNCGCYWKKEGEFVIKLRTNMRKHTLTFIALFWLSFSIQAQHLKNPKENSSLFEGVIKTVVIDDERARQSQYLYT
ncbi:MAG TPA: hypothetical protein VGB00_10675, partial [Pyrinomonadaceae bacterium]